jgi:hypothetical protein
MSVPDPAGVFDRHHLAVFRVRLELPPPAHFEGANDPETFKAIAEESVALVLTPTLVE